MATIAALALKVSANIGDLVGKMDQVGRSVGAVADKAVRLTPNLKNLENATYGLETAMGALNVMNDKLDDALSQAATDSFDSAEAFDIYKSSLQGNAGGIRKEIIDTTAVVAKLYEVTVKNVSAAAEELKRIPASFEGVEKAFRTLENVQGIQGMEGLSTVISDFSELDTATRQAADSVEGMSDRWIGSIGTATPSLANLRNAINDLGTAQGVSSQFDAMTGATDSFRGAIILAEDQVSGMADRVAADIGKVTPSIEGMRQACAKFEELKKMAAEMQALTGNSDAMREALETAESAMGDLATGMVQAKVEGAALNTVIAAANFPVAIAIGVFKDILDDIMSIFSTLNEKLGGWPGFFGKLAVVILTVAAAIGYATTQTIAWGTATSFLQSLWSTNFFVVGLKGFAALIPKVLTGIGAAIIATINWIAAQWQLNIALSANPVGLIIIGITAVVALIAGLVVIVTAVWSWWSRSVEETEKVKKNITDTITANERFRDGIKETVEKYKELSNLAKQYRSDVMTASEKYEADIKKVYEVYNKSGLAKKAVHEINEKIAATQTALDQARRQKQTEEMKQQIKNLENDLKGFQNQKAEIANTPAMTVWEKRLKDEQIRQEYLQDVYGDLLEKTASAQEEYRNTIAQTSLDVAKNRMTQAERDLVIANAKKKLAESVSSLIPETAQQTFDKNMEKLNLALSISAITQTQYAAGVENARKKFNETDPAIKETAELKKKFQEMINKVPGKEFDELSAQLEKVKDQFNAGDLAAITDKMADGLARNLGIDKYLTAGDDTLESKKRELADTYGKLIEYANRTNMADEALAAAKSRAAEEILKQTDAGKALFDAMDSLIPLKDKIAKAQSDIIATAAELRNRGKTVSDEAIQTALDKSEEEIRKKNKADTPAQKQTAGNAALERGTIAYFEMTQKQNDPILKENQKQTKTLGIIAKNTLPRKQEEQYVDIT